MHRVTAVLFSQARRIVLTVLLGGLMGATMVRLGPGFGTDERELATDLSHESKEAIRAERAADSNVVKFYARYLAGLFTGNFGTSQSFNRPVGELIGERLPATAASLAFGVGGGIALGLLFAAATVVVRVRASDFIADVSSGLMLSVPAAVLALVFLWTGANGRWAIALLVAPHVYRYTKDLLVSTLQSPHVLAARARGVSKARLLVAHVAAPVAPHMLALCGMCVTLAFSASIPVEVVCDTPGIGQLVWKSALSRDLPLLVPITMLVALLVLVVNTVADLAIAVWTGESAAS